MNWYEHIYQSPFDPASVMPRDMRDWKSYQQSVEHAAPASINQRLVALNRFFSWAIMQRLCRDNPVENIGPTPLPVRQPKGMKPNDLRRLLRAARSNPRDYAILEILAGTGLRVSELLALKVGDVILNERSGIVIVREGKQGSYREVPLTLDVRKALSAYLEAHHLDASNPEAAFWLGRKGTLTARSSVTRMLGKYARLAQIAPPSPHVLRHTFATRYLAANVDDIRGLARLLGHSSLNTVMIYTEPDLETLTARMERVDTLYD